jgi:hypothetical protein
MGEHAEEDQKMQYGVRRPAKIKDPKLPSKDEIEERCLTHLPFRSWCSHCVRAEGEDSDHRLRGRSDGLPEVRFEYCFMGSVKDSAGDKSLLVGREKSARSWCRRIVSG